MVIMIFLAVYSFTMPGAKEGLKFYLVPDMQQILRRDTLQSSVLLRRWIITREAEIYREIALAVATPAAAI